MNTKHRHIFTIHHRNGMHSYNLHESNNTYNYKHISRLLGALMIIVCIVFIISSIYSFKQEDKSNFHKRLFYCLLPLFFSIWFIWYFVRIPIGNILFPWIRDYVTIIITLVWQTITFISMMYFFYMITLKSPSKPQRPHDKVSVPDYENDDDDDDDDDDTGSNENIEMGNINKPIINNILSDDVDGDETTNQGSIHANPNPLMAQENTYIKVNQNDTKK